jgi:hypothetical protein
VERNNRPSNPQKPNHEPNHHHPCRKKAATISTTKWNRLTANLLATAKQFAANTVSPYSTNDFTTKGYAITFRVKTEQLEPLLRELAQIQSENPIKIQALACEPLTIPVITN